MILRRPCRSLRCSCASPAAAAPERARTTRRAACSRTAAPTGRRARPSRRSTTSTPSSPASRTPTPWTTRCWRSAATTWRWRATPSKAREAFEQVAKRFPQSDGAPGAYYYLGRLTLERRHHRGRARRRAGPVRARAAPVPAQRVGAAGPLRHRASRTARRDASPRRSEAARRVALEYPTSDAAPARAVRGGPGPRAHGRAAPGHGGVPAGPQPLPGERVGAARARPHHRALPAVRRRASPPSRSTRRSRVGAGDVLKDVRALLMTPGAHALGRLRQGEERGAVRRPTARWAPAWPARTCAAWPWRRGGELVVAAQAAVRVGPARHPDLRHPRRQARRDGAAGAASRPRCVTPGGAVLVADEKRKQGLPLRRASSSTRARSPTPRSARSARMALDGEGGIVLLDRDEKTVRVLDETGKVLRTLRRARRRATSSASRWTWPSTPSATSTWRTRRRGVLVFSPQGQLLATAGRRRAAQARAR